MATPPFDLTTFLPYCLNQAAERASLAFAEVYQKKYGISRAEWRVLAHLGQFGAMTATEICQRSGLHKTKVSRAVFSLAERRWVARKRDDGDRRVEHLQLTKSGLAAFTKLGDEALSHDRQLAQKLNQGERETLLKILKKLSS